MLYGFLLSISQAFIRLKVRQIQHIREKMPTEPEIKQCWFNLLTAQGAQFGPPDYNGHGYKRWGIGYYNEGLTDAGVADHLEQMLESIRNTSTQEGFEMTQVRAADLEFHTDDTSGARLGVACFYSPTRPVPPLLWCGS